jgi:hypothetical protein
MTNLTESVTHLATNQTGPIIRNQILRKDYQKLKKKRRNKRALRLRVVRWRRGGIIGSLRHGLPQRRRVEFACLHAQAQHMIRIFSFRR